MPRWRVSPSDGDKVVVQDEQSGRRYGRTPDGTLWSWCPRGWWNAASHLRVPLTVQKMFQEVARADRT